MHSDAGPGIARGRGCGYNAYWMVSAYAFQHGTGYPDTAPVSPGVVDANPMHSDATPGDTRG
ncbi:hypothetical protein GCM10028803_35380 [Larkinella knui]